MASTNYLKTLRSRRGYRTPSSFRNKVLKVVSSIPEGKMLTYQEVARISGNTKAYRSVGNILNKNYDSRIPCHRVVRSDGKVGGYNRGAEMKRALLRRESISKG